MALTQERMNFVDLYILFTFKLVKESIFKKHQLCNIHIYQEHGAWYGYNQSLQCQYHLYQSPVWHSTGRMIFAYQAYRSTTKPYLLDCLKSSPEPGGPRSGPDRTPNVQVQVQIRVDLDLNYRSRSSWWVDWTWSGPGPNFVMNSPKKSL